METVAWFLPTSDGRARWITDYDVPALEARKAGKLVEDLVRREDADSQLRIACAMLTECEAALGAIDPECESEAHAVSKLRAQVVDFLADAGLTD